MGGFLNTGLFGDQLEQERQKRNFYNQYGNPLPVNLPPKMPETDQSQVNAQQDMVPVQQSRIQSEIPREKKVRYENPYKTQLEEQIKSAPSYEEPSKTRKVLSNILKVGSALAAANAGSSGVFQLGERAGNYIEHEPYNKKVRAYQSELNKQQQLAGTEGTIAGQEAKVNELLATEAEKEAQRGAEEARANYFNKRLSPEILNLQSQNRINEKMAGVKPDLYQIKGPDGKTHVVKLDAKTGTFTPATDEEVTSINKIGTPSQTSGKTVEERIQKMLHSDDPDEVAAGKELEQMRVEHAAKIAEVQGNDPKTKQALANAGLVNKSLENKILTGKVQDEATIRDDANKVTHLTSAINNPDYLTDTNHFGGNKAEQLKAQQSFQKLTGLPAPKKVSAETERNERTNRNTLSNVNNILKLVQDPEVQQMLGPLNGRKGNIDQLIGDSFQGAGPETKAGMLRTALSQLQANEYQLATNGRGSQKVFDVVMHSAPQANFSLPRLVGALQQMKKQANSNLQSVQSERFGEGNSPDVEFNGSLYPKFRIKDGIIQKWHEVKSDGKTQGGYAPYKEGQ